jgi:hypothetical protein
MKTKFLLVVTVVLLVLAGVPLTAQKLYPVQGPLAAQSPPPVFTGQIRRPPFSAGPVFKLLKSWKLSGGEVLNGKVAVVKASSQDAAAPGTQADYPPQSNLASAWDAVYGQGYFVAHILGNEFMQGVFTGSKGTTLQVESLDGQKGVAVDNQGNIYKMVW